MSRSCDTLTRVSFYSGQLIRYRSNERSVFVDSGVRNSVTVMTIES